MSTLLHPAGPEPEQTYWMRRAVVLAVLVLVLALLIWGVTSLFNRSSDQGGDPVPRQTSPIQSPTAQSPTAQSPAAQSSPLQVSPSGTPAASMSPTTSPTGTSVAVTSTTASPATPAATTAASTPATTTSAPVSSAAPTSVAPTGPVACNPTEVVPDITGATRVNTGRTVNLNITLTSTKDCVIDFGATGLETRIYSGNDRIWSSNDCSTHKPTGSANLGPGKAWGYTIAWNTKRSLGQCQLDTAFLQPGTYVATVVLSGGQPVQHVMTVLA